MQYYLLQGAQYSDQPERQVCMSPFIQYSGKGKTTRMDNPLSVGAWTMGERGSSRLQKGHLGGCLRIVMFGSAVATKQHIHLCQWEFAVLLRELKRGLCDRLKGGMGRETGGKWGGRGQGCTYG